MFRGSILQVSSILVLNSQPKNGLDFPQIGFLDNLGDFLEDGLGYAFGIRLLSVRLFGTDLKAFANRLVCFSVAIL